MNSFHPRWPQSAHRDDWFALEGAATSRSPRSSTGRPFLQRNTWVKRRETTSPFFGSTWSFFGDSACF